MKKKSLDESYVIKLRNNIFYGNKSLLIVNMLKIHILILCMMPYGGTVVQPGSLPSIMVMVRVLFHVQRIFLQVLWFPFTS